MKSTSSVSAKPAIMLQQIELSIKLDSHSSRYMLYEKVFLLPLPLKKNY